MVHIAFLTFLRYQCSDGKFMQINRYIRILFCKMKSPGF